MDKWELQRANLTEGLPVDVYPASNGEFLPGDPTPAQHAVMALADHETERARRRFGMSRRDFVRTSAAMTIGIWALGSVTNGRWGRYAFADEHSTDACDLQWPGAQLNNLPGEFILDLQSHHVDSGGAWRYSTNVRQAVLFSVIWPQAGPLGGLPGYEDGEVRGWGNGGEIDPIENLSRYHYLKELYLDSSTTMCVLSAVPSPEEFQALPLEEAAKTVRTVNALAQETPRCVMHPFVMPNRGSLGTNSDDIVEPVFLGEELERMEEAIDLYPDIVRGWKTYPAYGDVPYASGWYHDDEQGLRFAEQVVNLSDKYGVPKIVCTHKGFALPGFDQEKASARDIGPAAKAFPEVDWVVYHGGFDGETQHPYPGDDEVEPTTPAVDTLIRSLRVEGWDAESHVPHGLAHGNAPNVYAELGTTWRDNMSNPDSAAHLLGKLIKYVGPQRVVWGTDSLWFGSPQSEIVALRAFEFTDEAKEFYNLPYGLEGDRFDPRYNAHDSASYLSAHPVLGDWPTDGRSHPERSIRNGIFGRNAAPLYHIDPDAARAKIDCDDVQKVRDAYLINPNTPDPRQSAPAASNEIQGHRTRRSVLKDVYETPWSP